MDRKMFVLQTNSRNDSVKMRRESEFFDGLGRTSDGKSIDDLTLGERGSFPFLADEAKAVHSCVDVMRVNDDESVSYGPFLTAKQYGSAMLHLMQAFEDIRLAAHYMDGDPCVGRAVKMLGSKIAEMYNQLRKLKMKAEAPTPTKVI